jgi:hypothetical protein
MLIFEVTDSQLEEATSRKYKCKSGPRKGQRVAKISTCSAQIRRRGHSQYDDTDDQSSRTYVPQDRPKTKNRKKKKITPHRSGIQSEAQVNEYSNTSGINKSKISNLKPGIEAEIDHGDGTKTKVDLKQNPQALTKDDKGSIKLNQPTKPGQKPNPAKLIKKGDAVDLNDENK